MLTVWWGEASGDNHGGKASSDPEAIGQWLW